MSSMKEIAIREYLSNINFKSDDWKISGIEDGLRRFLGETPGINIIYKKDLIINERSGEAKEIQDIDRLEIVFTDLDNRFKKLEFII